ncbi:MAG: nucleotidyltransferase domain-containing protein [Bacteroidales bacterium]|nr:nucleotidyltransferase domain-containing protein [Bacteroidales bacterium]MCF8338215.1 nucleotidyltransferase domain-containing protein [Bacteroidales bacterium]
MTQEEAINKVKAYTRLLEKHFDLEKVYLFGSYAKDEPREDSDIDVAVVVKHVEGDFFSVNPLLWKLRRQIDDRIEPILIEKDHDEAGFLEDIQKNGIEIS